MLDRIFPIALLTMTLLATPAIADENMRQVAVSGSGEVTVVPDRAQLSMGVEMRARELQSARDQVGKTISEFLTLVKQLGIEKKSVNTSQLTVRPEYDWIAAARKRQLTGYYVARQVQVELDDLEKLGMLLERATAIGINQVSGPFFKSSREDELQRTALRRAAEDARLNAQVLAETLGAKLGPVHNIQAGAMHLPRPPMMARAMLGVAAESADAEQSYEPGEIRIQAQVNAVFDLLIAP